MLENMKMNICPLSRASEKYIKKILYWSVEML